MAVYLISFTMSLLVTCIAGRTQEYRRKKLLGVLALLCGLPLFLVSALRYGVGTDYFGYTNLFNEYFSVGVAGKVEPLFFALNYLIASIHWDVQWVFVICSFIIVNGTFLFILKESDSPVFSVFLYFTMAYYAGSLNTMRQAVAMSFTLFAALCARKRKFFLFAILIVVAFLIHRSSIVIAPCYLLCLKRKPLTKSIAWGWLLFTIVFSGLSSVAIGPLINRVVSITSYANYVSGSSSSFNSASILGLLVQLAILILGFVYFKENKKYSFYFKIQVIAVCVTSLGNSVNLINRVKWYYSIFSIVFLPLIVKGVDSKREKGLVTLSTVLAFSIYFFVVVVVKGSQGTLPYRSILGA